jgi:hypothetical protein
VTTFDGQPGANWNVCALATFDDGAGDALYAAGNFSEIGNQPIASIARWNGADWSPLANDINGVVFALTVFDDGSGPALYAGGHFTIPAIGANNIARWDGQQWTVLGSGVDNSVFALEVFDDGGGAALYAAGAFANAGASPAGCVAKWNGAVWSPLRTGLVWPSAPAYAYGSALAVFDDGGGPQLYVGGAFTLAGGQPAINLARWSSVGWSSVGGTDTWATISSLRVFDDGHSGALLYAGGSFTTIGGTAANRVARWNGSAWAALASGLNSSVTTLGVFENANGSELIATGGFTLASGVSASHIAKWNGLSWSAMGSGIGNNPTDGFAVQSFDDGHGPRLFVGGDFQSVGGVPARRIAAWNGTAWSPVGEGLNSGVRALATFDDGHAMRLFAGGEFTHAGGFALKSIGEWNGALWSPLGAGITRAQGSSSVQALTMFDDGSGSALYVGGYFDHAGGLPASNIAKWSGSSWSALGSGANGAVQALASFDDGSGPALYAGGLFTIAGGGAVANGIAKWNGLSWSGVGGGLSSLPASALATFDDGTGTALYVGGSFFAVGSLQVSSIAKWNGATWSALGNGIGGTVAALCTFDDGSGPALYAGGTFTGAGGAPVNNIAKWNGSSWSALSTGLDGGVYSLRAFDNGNGPVLVAGGDFLTAGGVAANRLAKWNGTNWSAVGSGANGAVLALAAHDDSSGPALFAGGLFTDALDSHDSFLAKWGCPFARIGTSFCTSTTTSNGCLPLISAWGHSSASATSTFTIFVANVPGQRTGMTFYGLDGPSAAPWGTTATSLLCVKPPLQRMDSMNSGGVAGACNGLLTQDWNAFVVNHPAALGNPFSRGQIVWAQAWFRDPPSPRHSALSNGLVFAVGP